MDALSQGQSMLLEASGLAVGLPDGLMGNSEVGHYTIGTGRVSYQVCLCVCVYVCFVCCVVLCVLCVYMCVQRTLQKASRRPAGGSN